MRILGFILIMRKFAKVKRNTCPDVRIAVVFAVILAGYTGGASSGEWAASFYGGKARTGASEVTLNQPGGTDLRFDKVSWDDESFKPPIYWGARLTRWSESAAGWGAALDFTHAKMSARPEQVVHVSGTSAGAQVNADQALGGTFASLSFTHGFNLLTANALYRWQAWQSSTLGEISPYAGAGLGVAWPHVEIAAGGQTTAEYQVAGPALQGLVGLDLKAFDRVSVFVEYKLSRADMRIDIAGGGSVRLNPATQHAIVGGTYRFR
jgi:lipid A oxidase